MMTGKLALHKVDRRTGDNAPDCTVINSAVSPMG